MGPGRIGLPTSRLSGARSNQLSYGPKTWDAGALITGAATEITRPSVQVNNYFARKSCPSN